VPHAVEPAIEILVGMAAEHEAKAVSRQHGEEPASRRQRQIADAGRRIVGPYLEERLVEEERDPRLRLLPQPRL
jgi:hypothetical protein